MSKPIHAKPALYTLFYEHIKIIAKECGYNLLLHGSLHRDLDLVAVPWMDKPQSELVLIQQIDEYLSGRFGENKEHYSYSVLPGGRSSYVINLNRGNKKGEWSRFDDEQYYLDISVTPLIIK